MALHVAGLVPGGMPAMRGPVNRAWNETILQEPIEIYGRWYAPVDWKKAFAKFPESLDTGIPPM